MRLPFEDLVWTYLLLRFANSHFAKLSHKTMLNDTLIHWVWAMIL